MQSFANCSKSVIFEGFLLPAAFLKSLHMCSMGFRSRLIIELSSAWFQTMVVITFHDAFHTVETSVAKSSKVTPKHLWTSTTFDWRDSVLFSEDLILFSVNSEQIYQKAVFSSQLSTGCSSRRILVLFWQSPVWLLFNLRVSSGSPTRASLFIQIVQADTGC